MINLLATLVALVALYGLVLLFKAGPPQESEEDWWKRQW